MYRGVGVLLRVEYPDHDVGHADQPVDSGPGVIHDRVVIGQVKQDQAGEVSLTAVEFARTRVPGPGRNAKPI